MNILIVSGGQVYKDQLMAIWEREAPYVIGVDHGCITLISLGLKPDLAVGDFDSVTEEERPSLDRLLSDPLVRSEVLIPEKDDTDTEHALRLAIDMKPEKILMFGCTGTRLDQTVSSIMLLRLAVEAEIPCFIQDMNNRIRVGRGKTILKRDELFGRYVSVLPYGNEARHLTISGFKYDVEDYNLEAREGRGISNELLSDTGVIESGDYYIIMETVD